MRSLWIIAIACLAWACGSDDEGHGADADRPAICDLASIAPTLIGPAGSCPPQRVLIDPVEGRIHRYGQASWTDDQACTQFEIDGAGCSSPCAPTSCSLEAGSLVCDERCSRELITCFIIPASACEP